MSMVVDSATGGDWEELGDVIQGAGKEDSSGARRQLAQLIRDNDLDKAKQEYPQLTPARWIRLRALL